MEYSVSRELSLFARELFPLDRLTPESPMSILEPSAPNLYRFRSLTLIDGAFSE